MENTILIDQAGLDRLLKIEERMLHQKKLKYERNLRWLNKLPERREMMKEYKLKYYLAHKAEKAIEQVA